MGVFLAALMSAAAASRVAARGEDCVLPVEVETVTKVGDERASEPVVADKEDEDAEARELSVACGALFFCASEGFDGEANKFLHPV